MGVSEQFNGFCSNLVVTKTDSISREYKAITKCLNRDFWNTESEFLHSLYFGSYGRNTAINGFSDLDMIFQLPYLEYEKYKKYSGNGQFALLEEIRSLLKKTYSATDIGADGNVIVVPFDNGITFEVVPAFINKDDSFTYPDSKYGGQWKVTNPKPEIKAIKSRDSICNGNLIPLCRMMHAWKINWSVPIGGILIDTLAYQFILDWQHNDNSYVYYDWMSRDFFEFMANQDSKRKYWKAPGSGQYVYGKGLFQYKAKRCYNISLKAIKLQDDNQEDRSSNQKWREIYGIKFPS